MTLLLFHSQPARSSGVFELEFIRIEQLDIENRASSQNSQLGGPVSPPSANKRQLEQQQDPSKLVRIFVCLKEAFTNQLDGQCTYGNASINLQRDSIMQATPIKPKAINQIQGSLLTNTVRIPFTFRWTVSSPVSLPEALAYLVIAVANEQLEIQETRIGLISASAGGEFL